MKIAVVGAGSWGTTIAKLLGEKGFEVKLWVFEKELVDNINQKGENTQYLAGIKLPKTIRASSSLKDVVKDAELIVSAIPSQFLRETTKQYAGYIKKGVIVVSTTKGLEEGSHKRASQVLEEELADVKVAALSGPTHAEEVSIKMPTAAVIASNELSILEKLKKIFETDYFKVYPHDDIIGVEICGAVKNITAIATGIVDGLGFGDNSRGTIITLGLTEMNSFGRLFGAKQNTVYGLAGVGDLVATCTSKHSRNRFVGEKLAQGKSLEEINELMHGMVAEGIKTAKVIHDFGKKKGIEFPLTAQVYNVLYEKKNIAKAVEDLKKLI